MNKLTNLLEKRNALKSIVHNLSFCHADDKVTIGRLGYTSDIKDLTPELRESAVNAVTQIKREAQAQLAEIEQKIDAINALL